MKSMLTICMTAFSGFNHKIYHHLRYLETGLDMRYLETGLDVVTT
jgi:hypothetical protein